MRQIAFLLSTVTLFSLFSNAATAQQTTTGSPMVVSPANMNSGYYCQKCGRFHDAPSVSQSSSTSNVLGVLNRQRSRQGLPSLRYDSVLQAVAERRARKMASMGLKGHPPGSFAPGRYEGVGWSSSHATNGVHACYTSDPRMTAAGAAMVSGRDGVYFAVVYR